MSAGPGAVRSAEGQRCRGALWGSPGTSGGRTAPAGTTYVDREDQVRGIACTVDLVLVVDATGSMSATVDRIRDRSTSLYRDLHAAMVRRARILRQLRVRVVAYRDFYADPPADALVVSAFFALPDEEIGLSRFVARLVAKGGGDEPETGLEALAEAIRSPWSAGGPRSRQVVVVCTDASAHRLEREAGGKPAGYPAGMPADLDALTDMWESPAYVDQRAKRLLVYAPAAYAWTQIGDAWENAVHIIARPGEGLAEVTYAEIVDAIARSV